MHKWSPAPLAPVMNGEVKAGDEIAFGCRDGDRGGMRIATIVEVEVRDSLTCRYDAERGKFEDVPVYRLKVHVTKTSGYSRAGYVTRVGTELVVKLT